MLISQQRVESALRDLKQGKMIILTDHPDRENEGDLIFPAETTTAEKINFMLRYCSGIICLSLDDALTQKMELNFMVSPHENTSNRGTPFTVSIEAKNGVTTGVSAHDRAKTILTVVDDAATADDLVKPGHIFPLRAKKNGVLERAGHTEGALDLARLAGFKAAAVLCEIMNHDGSMAKGHELVAFAQEHQLQILSITDLIEYRLATEDLIEENVSAKLPLNHYGEFTISVVKEKISNTEHMVLTKDIKDSTNIPLVRIHSSCATGDLFGSQRCDCNQQLHYSLEKISQEGGMLIYLYQEGRGIGLLNKIKAYALQEQGLDTVQANQALGLPVDAREYFIAANILRNHGLHHVRLLTNNPQKIQALKKYGISTVQHESTPIFSNKHNKNYLSTKKDQLHHLIDMISGA